MTTDLTLALILTVVGAAYFGLTFLESRKVPTPQRPSAFPQDIHLFVFWVPLALGAIAALILTATH